MASMPCDESFHKRQVEEMFVISSIEAAPTFLVAGKKQTVGAEVRMATMKLLKSLYHCTLQSISLPRSPRSHLISQSPASTLTVSSIKNLLSRTFSKVSKVKVNFLVLRGYFNHAILYIKTRYYYAMQLHDAYEVRVAPKTLLAPRISTH